MFRFRFTPRLSKIVLAARVWRITDRPSLEEQIAESAIYRLTARPGVRIGLVLHMEKNRFRLPVASTWNTAAGFRLEPIPAARSAACAGHLPAASGSSRGLGGVGERKAPAGGSGKMRPSTIWLPPA